MFFKDCLKIFVVSLYTHANEKLMEILQVNANYDEADAIE